MSDRFLCKICQEMVEKPGIHFLTSHPHRLYEIVRPFFHLGWQEEEDNADGDAATAEPRRPRAYGDQRHDGENDVLMWTRGRAGQTPASVVVDPVVVDRPDAEAGGKSQEDRGPAVPEGS